MEKVGLVGHSMGGDAVVHAARRLGDRVAGLVWIDVFRSLGNEPVAPPEDVEAFVAPSARTLRPRSTIRLQTSFRRPPIAELIDRISPDMAATSRGGCARLPALCPQPPAGDPRGAATHRGADRGDQPRYRARPTSARCAGTVLSRSFSTMSVIPDVRGPGAVESGAGRGGAGSVRAVEESVRPLDLPGLSHGPSRSSAGREGAQAPRPTSIAWAERYSSAPSSSMGEPRVTRSPLGPTLTPRSGRPSAKAKAALTEVVPERRLVWDGTVGPEWLFAGHREFLIAPQPDGTVLLHARRRCQRPAFPTVSCVHGRRYPAPPRGA